MLDGSTNQWFGRTTTSDNRVIQLPQSHHQTLDTYQVWDVISCAWTEIGLDDDEFKTIAQKASLKPEHLPQIDRIFFKDICASFAVDSLLIFQLMIWMLIPDWGYSERYLRKRVLDWYSRPYWKNFLNPIKIAH